MEKQFSEKRQTRLREILTSLKRGLGFDEFNRLKELFFHVCISKYEYKLLVTRRAYLLYKIFEAVFQCFPGERPNISEPFKSFGKVYNSHSMFLLTNIFENGNGDEKLLVVDDIIVYGRAVSNVMRDLQDKVKIPKNQIYIWCFYKNSMARCISKDVEDRLMVYKITSNQIWKKASDVFTEAIVKNGQGYTSFVDTYVLENFVDRIPEEKNNLYIIGNADQKIELPTGFTVKLDVLEKFNVQSWIYFPQEIADYPNSVGCIRFYLNETDLLVIPYLFIKDVYVENVYGFVFELLKQYNIQQIPKEFIEDYDSDSKRLITLFLKWSVNRIGQELIKHLLRNNQMDYNPDFTVLHKETFPFDNEVDIPNQFTWNNTKVEESVPDKDFCLGAFSEIVKKKYEAEQQILSLDDLKQVYTQYAFYIKEEDERRAALQQNRCLGISAFDSYETVTGITNLEAEAKEEALREVLSLYIMQWDIGEASYNLYEISSSETGAHTFASGLMCNGEQVYKRIYNLYSYVYPYFKCFTQRTYEYRHEELERFGTFLKSIFDKQERKGLITEAVLDLRKKELRNFLDDMQMNSSYFDDAFVIRGQDIAVTKEIAGVVDEYVRYQY